MNLLWDQHACLPLQVGTDVGVLSRFGRPGPTFVSVNAGYSPHSFADSVALLNYYRTAVARHPELAVIATVDDIDAAGAAGRIAVAFDLEDSNPLDGDLANVHAFADLGVRTLVPTYNPGP